MIGQDLDQLHSGDRQSSSNPILVTNFSVLNAKHSGGVDANFDPLYRQLLPQPDG
jgi:hypothetical protein